MEPKRVVFSALTQSIEHRINQSTTRLLQDPKIKQHIQRNPALKHALHMAIARGEIPEHGGVEKAHEVIQQALHGAKIANKLETRIQRRRGKPHKLAQELQAELRKQAHLHEQASKLIKNATFAAYLRKMALNLHALGHTAQNLQQNNSLAMAILDHITAEYQLMKDLGVPNSIIKRHAHKFSIFQVNGIYKDCHREFGDNEETRPLVRTAAHLLFQKKFRDAKEAKRTYQKHLKAAQQTFGQDSETQTLVRTAAHALFLNKFQSAKQAKQTYEKHLRAAKAVFGTDPETQTLVRTAAVMLLQNKFKSAQEAKQTYQRYLQQAEETFGQDEDTKPLVRTAAVILLQNKFKSAQEAKQVYQKHFKAAKAAFGTDPETAPLIRTTALMLFQNKFSNAKEAKQTYEKHLRAAKAAFGGGLKSASLVRTVAYMLFQKQSRNPLEARQLYQEQLLSA